MKSSFSLDHYVRRLGGRYIMLVMGVAQLTAIAGAILGSIAIWSNANFDPNTAAKISQSTPWLLLAQILILSALVWYLTPNARTRLTDWTRNQLSANPKEELAAC